MALASKLSAGVLALMLACVAARADDFAEFRRQIAGEARTAGIGAATVAVLDTITLDCRQTGVTCGSGGGGAGAGASNVAFEARTGLPASCNKVTQPEFLQPNNYFPKASMDRLVAQGRAMLARWRTSEPATERAIARIEKRFGVPRAMLLAVWARETAFGKAGDGHNAIRALAGLAFAGAEARRPLMRRQLLAALTMLDRGVIGMAEFRSSWAGATGLTQIMPDEYLKHGTDGDGDGRIDIWRSVPDALATTAATLQSLGWNGAFGWGQEVKVPRQGHPRFACTLQSSKHRRPFSAWLRAHDLEPLARPAGPAFPSAELAAYLIMPGGFDGPAFLVSDNFEVLRAYNTSDLYGLYVGTLADRIACPADETRCRIKAAWPADRNLESFPYSVANLCRVQVNLARKGFSPGPIDGLIGAQMRVAIGQYQESAGRVPDCYPTRALFDELGDTRAAAGSPRRTP